MNPVFSRVAVVAITVFLVATGWLALGIADVVKGSAAGAFRSQQR